MSSSQLEETTVRDFGGGWNVSDSDKALSSRFQPVSDNVVRGTDGHFRVRYGDMLFADMQKGTSVDVALAAFNVTTVNASAVLKITKAAHGYASGDHVTITSFSADVNGLLAANIVGKTFGIVVNDANNFSIYVRGAATSSGTVARNIAWTRDTHVLSGRTIYGRYYKNHIIVFTDGGEIAAVDAAGVATRIWSYQIAAALTLPPWTTCKRVSAEIIRGRLIAVNGAENDKPLAIDDTTVNYLVDASTLSNGAIPRAEFVIAASQYVVLVNTEYGPTMLEIGAKNTVMTCSREVSPSDAVEVDVGMLTQTIDSTILGASVIRSQVFLGFADRTMLGKLGIYNTSGVTPIHEPDFNDNLAEFGTFSHASIISLGNDLFCAGLNGINSLSISQVGGEYVPATVSDLIHPVMLRHFARLSEDDRRYRTFAVFDNTARAYMLFAPKYSATSDTLTDNPIYATSTLQQYDLMYVRYPNHALDSGDYIDISGVTDFGALLGSMVNGRRRIRHVVDKSTLVIEVDPYPANTNESFGGNAVVIAPVNDETIGYVYEYNSRLKIRRWTRFRGMDYDWGTRSQLNRLFFGKNGKIYVYGDNSNKYSADHIGDYDALSWSNATPYVAGYRVLDSSNNTIYQCLLDHVSAGAGTFAAARLANDALWAEFEGYPISWEMETSWTDFKMRKMNKQIELCGFDTEGSAEFEFSIFTNSIRQDFESLLLAPNRSTVFVGENTPGFGGGDQPFGGGRNTAQEWLHSIPAFGKLFRLRFAGSSIHPLTINAVTLYYHKSRVLT